MIAAAWSAFGAFTVGLLGGIVLTTVIYERDEHRRWLERIAERDGPDVAAVADAEWTVRRAQRAPWKWLP